MSVNEMSHPTYVLVVYVKILPRDFFPFPASFSYCTGQRSHCHEVFIIVLNRFNRQIPFYFGRMKLVGRGSINLFIITKANWTKPTIFLLTFVYLLLYVTYQPMIKAREDRYNSNPQKTFHFLSLGCYSPSFCCSDACCLAIIVCSCIKIENF